MREYLYPERELRVLGDQLLLDPRTNALGPLPTTADRNVAVLVALIAQGVTFELDLIGLASETTGAATAYVERLMRLFDGRDPGKHLWTSDDEGNYLLLSTLTKGVPEWRPDWETELAKGPPEWPSFH